jgi:hypothetical protein
MLGALLKTTVEARAKREVLLAEAAVQRQRMAVYLDAFDPAAHWLERLLSAVKFVLERPVIPAGVLAALVILKPRRLIRIAVLAWKALSWVRRIKTALQ